MNIHSFELRNELCGTYSYDEENADDRMDSFTKESTSVVHKDLLTSLESLKPHVALMMGWQPDLLKRDADVLSGIKILGVDFHLRDYVSIKFTYVMPKLGYKMKMTTPKISFTLDEMNYPPIKKLKTVVDTLYTRVEDYHNGVFGDGEQLTIYEQEKASKKKKQKVDAGDDEEHGDIVVEPSGALSDKSPI